MSVSVSLYMFSTPMIYVPLKRPECLDKRVVIIDVLATIRPFTDEGGCIVTEASEFWYYRWASVYQRIMTTYI